MSNPIKIVHGRPSAIPSTDIVGGIPVTQIVGNPAPFIYGNLEILVEDTIPSVGTGVSFPHGLPNTPDNARVVLLCLTNDTATGYVSGQEINIESVLDGTNSFVAFAINIDEVNVNIYRSSGTNNFQLIPNGGGAITKVTAETNFEIKIYLGYTLN